MSSFDDIIRKKEESHAYMAGVDAFLVKSSRIPPAAWSADAQLEWYDGYEDAQFIYKAERNENEDPA